VLPQWFRQETLTVYNEIVDYIGKKLGKKTIIVQRPTYSQMNELVENKHVLQLLSVAAHMW